MSGTSAKEVVAVIVRNDLTGQTISLDAAALERFNEQWRGKQVSAGDGDPNWQARLDIAFAGGSGGRWWYAMNGDFQVLAMKHVTRYRVPNPEAMNRLLDLEAPGRVDEAAPARD
ncbi:hypothetical protein [Ahniella affigens]|nr:hypothetical protein [Ahniella affigens]